MNTSNRNLASAALALSLSLAAFASDADAASKITFGDCSHPEPRIGSSFKHPSGGAVSVIGGNSDIVEFRFDGICLRDYIRDGRGLGGSDVRLGTTPAGVKTVLVRMGRKRDMIRVYAILPDGTIVGAFDRIQDGSHLSIRAQADGTFHVTYGRKKDLAGSYWFSLEDRAWRFGNASRGRNWEVLY